MTARAAALALSSARKTRTPRAKLLGRLQDLIGQAQAIYANDRAQDRADRLIPCLTEAFQIVVRLREVYKP